MLVPKEHRERKRKMRMSRLLLAPAAILTATVLALSGCAAAQDSAVDSTTSEADGTEADSGLLVYALLPQGSNSPYGTAYVPALQAKAAELGITLVVTNSDYDGDKQASECEVAIAAKPDGIILWPSIADTIRPCLEAAVAAGIPVWNSNANVNPEDQALTYGYSGPNDYEMAAASARIMCELAAGEDIGVILVNGTAGNSVAAFRKAGYQETLESECPNAKVVADQPGDWSKEGSQIAVSEMISAVGIENVKGFYGADDTMAVGAIAALEARGLNAADFYVTGLGHTFLGHEALLAGTLDGTVFQSSAWDGENAVIGIYRAIMGETKLGRDDAGSVLYMPTPVVTSKNVNDPEVAPSY
jgi:ribose transport system substrate-binding protein